MGCAFRIERTLSVSILQEAVTWCPLTSSAGCRGHRQLPSVEASAEKGRSGPGDLEGSNEGSGSQGWAPTSAQRSPSGHRAGQVGASGSLLVVTCSGVTDTEHPQRLRLTSPEALGFIEGETLLSCAAPGVT